MGCGALAIAAAGTAISAAGATGAFAPGQPQSGTPAGAAAGAAAADYSAMSTYDPLIAQLQAQIQPTLTATGTAENTAIRSANVADTAALAPQVSQTLQAYNPQSAGLLSTLTNQANQQLNLNGALDPFTKTAIANDVNAGTSARGLGTGTTDAAAVAYAENAQRTQNRANAQNFAGNVVSANNNFYGDPFTAILGTGSSGTSTVTSAGNAAPMSSIPSVVGALYGQQQGYANQLNTAGYNSQQQSLAAIPAGLNSIYSLYNSGTGGTGGGVSASQTAAAQSEFYGGGGLM